MRRRYVAAAALVALAALVLVLPARADAERGAGAWYVPGGSYSTDDSYAGLIPHWAMQSFQEALYRQRVLAYGSWAAENGRMGPDTSRAVAAFQRSFLTTHGPSSTPTGLRVTGRIGPATSRALFQPYVAWMEATLGIPRHYLHGVVSLESDYDPGAQGVNDATDRGLLQYNRAAYPDISDAEAYGQAIDRITQAGYHLRAEYDALDRRWPGRIRPSLRWSMATVAHFSPAYAIGWSDCYVFTHVVITRCAGGGALLYRHVIGEKSAAWPD